MNVAHVLLSLKPGGLERLVVSLAAAEPTRDLVTLVCCLDEVGELGPAIQAAGGTVVLERRRPGFDLRLVWRLARLLRQHSVSAVHTHSLDPMFYGGLAAMLARVPVRVHTQHNTFLASWSPWERLKFRVASLFMTRIVAVSHQTHQLALCCGAPGRRVRTVLNGIDCAALERPPRRVERPDSSLVIGTVARLSPEKGIHHLLAAFDAANRCANQLRLRIAGDGPERPRLEALAAQLESAPRIQFLGYRGDVGSVLDGLDLFVLPSLTEGIPLALLEAMAAGVPVIAAEVGGVPEVVTHLENGYLVPAGDTGALAGAITTLTRDSSLRATLAKNARERVRRDFSLSAMARAYRDIYTDRPETAFKRSGKALLRRLPRQLMLWRGSITDRRIAITFDDGPDPEYTPQVLDILRHYGATATFFLIGKNAEQHSALVERILAGGHELGNHSFEHAEFDRLSWSRATEEIERTQSLLERIQGKPCRIFRPPKGRLCAASLLPAWRNWLTVVMWSVDLKDFRALSAPEITAALGPRGISPGDVVLYHGNSRPAIEALPEVLHRARAAGGRFAPVSELLES
jgi:glycosyltransferase involved in cell wall biosynthesis/peptidoglycan/xylan/chitin deacetylase (PgdA/CDA1 family)